MHSVLPDVEKTCTLLMQKKVNKIPFSFHSQIITLFCLCYKVSNRALLSNKQKSHVCVLENDEEEHK